MTARFVHFDRVFFGLRHVFQMASLGLNLRSRSHAYCISMTSEIVALKDGISASIIHLDTASRKTESLTFPITLL